MNANLYTLFEKRFSQDDSQCCIETFAARRYSFKEVGQESARYARFLTGVGICKGDRVVVQVDKSPQALFLYLACLRAGFIYLPLNTAYQARELAYFLDNAEPAAVICNSSNYKVLKELSRKSGIDKLYTLKADGSGSFVDAIEGTEPNFKTEKCAPHDVAAILYTSGTTGLPKGAMLTHENLAENALALHAYWGWREGDVLLHALPIFHVHGLFVACHCALLNGSKMFFLPTFNSADVIRLLPESTVFMGVPTFYTRLLADPGFNKVSCRNMRLFISGSAPLLEQTFEEFNERTGHTILERYGMTETGMNTSNPLNGERLPGTVGLPLPGVEARIIDEHGEQITDGSVGQLQVKGKNVFKGYWQMPEKTAEDFTDDGFFKTGDIAKCNPDNGYISIVGRSKDMVICGGYNVYPKEVESCIDDLDGVNESAVIGLPHPDFGEAVVAIVVLENSAELAEQDIIGSLKQSLANYKVAKRVFIVDELPRNSMGKVQKNVLREQFQMQVEW